MKHCQDVEISTAEESLKTYWKYCEEHSRPIKQEILQDRMIAIRAEKNKCKQHLSREINAQEEHMNEGRSSVSTTFYSSDVIDQEEDQKIFEKKKQSHRVRSNVTSRKSGLKTLHNGSNDEIKSANKRRRDDNSVTCEQKWRRRRY